MSQAETVTALQEVQPAAIKPRDGASAPALIEMHNITKI